MKTIKQQYYSSTYNFVEINNLQAEATQLFGANWEAEDDVNQIEELINNIEAKFYVVEYIEGLSSDNDIHVYLSENLQEIESLKQAKKELIEVCSTIYEDYQLNQMGRELLYDVINKYIK